MMANAFQSAGDNTLEQMMTTLCTELYEAASQFANKPLFVFPATRWQAAESLTYGELVTRAAAASAVLSEYTSLGQRALLLFPTGAAFWEAFMGCLSAGVIAVPLHVPNLNRNSEQFASLCQDCDPAVLVVDDSVAEVLNKRRDQHPYFDGLPVVSPSQWRNQTAAPRFDATAQDIAFLQYTSGSTSRPKGVQISHANLLSNLRFICERMQLDAQHDRAVTWLPHYHDMGLVGSYLGAMFARLTSWCIPPEEFVLRPLHWLQLMSDHKVTISGGPDFGYRHCLEKIRDEDLSGLDFSSWRVAFVGAEKVRSETLARFVKRFSGCGFRREAFFPCYGLGEATLMATGGPVDAAPVIKQVSTAALARQQITPPSSPDDETSLSGSGQCFDGSRVLIIDTAGEPLPDEQIGEVCLAGPSVTRGYFQRQDLNAEQFFELSLDGQSHRFLRTGDVGFLSAGELFITGRNSELMIVRGKNLHPEDIEERVCAADAAIAPSGVLVFSTEINGQEELIVSAELQRTAIRDISPETVVAAIRYAVNLSFGVNPAEILLLRPATLPKTTSGKLRRLAFRQSYIDDEISCIYREINS
mgnify:CR=1 FL=1